MYVVHIIKVMTNYTWDAEKNIVLQEARGFGFADIVTAIDEGDLIDDIEHPSLNYSNQRILYVILSGYVVAVPYVMDEDSKFLKTAFHDRKANKKYLTR